MRVAGDHQHEHDHATHGPVAHGPVAHGPVAHGPVAHGHHGHHHGPATHDRAFAIGTALNAGFVVVELFYGWQANSVALLADATHNLGDVLSLLLAWGAAVMTRRPPTGRRTYGWGRSSILASLLNAMILLISIGAIGLETIQRLLAPQPLAEWTVMLVAAIGIAINGGTALLFLRGRAEDLNIRATYAHMIADMLVSLGVVAAAALIGLTGWMWLDPLTSLIIIAVIGIGTWSLLAEASSLAMDVVPGSVAEDRVHAYLNGLPGVQEVHDLHIWGLSTTEVALTAHLVMADADAAPLPPHEIAAGLRARFGIGHATVQTENAAEAELCRLRPGDVV